MIIIGIDLSGPANNLDTECVVFEERDDVLQLIGGICGATDRDIVAALRSIECPETVIVGLDAPLSYQFGGGDRPADRDLRQTLIKAGLYPGSVMPPTMTKMAYLTLRGMGVARLIADAGSGKMRVAEVHPGGAMVLGGAPLTAVKAFKNNSRARTLLLAWLAGQGLRGIDRQNPTDHYVAACACALAAWKWVRRRSAWLWPACKPHHPYDFVC